MSTNLGFEHTDSILIEERVFVPSPEIVDSANITAYMESKGFDNYEDFYRWSLAHRNEFWEDMAKELHWFEPWQTTFTWTDKPFFNWFAGGKFNIVYNCLDRYMQTPTRSKVAYYWEGDGGATRTISYEDLYLMTNRIAKGLQNLGVKKGDRVAIYMPMIPELIAAALAVARLGAAHMVVFGGFAASALRDRIIDCEAKVLITADGGFRGGKVIELKHIADEAIAETPAIQKAVVVRHTGMEVPMKAGRDIYMDELLADIPEATVVPCEPMDSEDLLYILYTSGSTGKPKGVVVPHRAVVNFLSSMAREPGLSANDVLVAVTTLSFDIAVLELYLPLTIGATVTHRTLERSPLVRARCPLVASVARHVANVRVRNVGTVGGNLAFADPHSDLATLFLTLDATVELVSPRGRRLLQGRRGPGTYPSALPPRTA